jgi:hypothetical protein
MTPPIRVLYLTGDNRMRASAHSLFLPLWKELRKNNVKVLETDTYMRYPNLRTDIFNGLPVNYLPKSLQPSYINSNYELIVIENLFPYWNEDWHKIKVKKVMMLGDLHRFDPKGTKFPTFMFDILQDKVGVSVIFSKYIETYHSIYKDVKLPVFHLPHSIDPTLFKNYGLKKEYDVLSTGSINGVYPKRMMLNEVFKGHIYYTRINRPNNNMITHPNPWPIGIDYAKELHKARISIACTSKYHYTIAKIFEIPACKSVLLCDYTKEMESLGFIPGHNFIEIRDNKVQYIEDLLHNTKKLNRICENGYNLVHNIHTIQQRVKEFITYCKEMI